jgi:valyl-tRNA synthetase
MHDKFLKPYNPVETEQKIYKMWEASGFFNPDNLAESKKGKFCIIMPPTNANGNLHAGHALVMTIEDIMIRFKRMQGYRVLWLPGNDHAGFETQVVYEKKLEKEGRSRFKIDPDVLYKEILDFTQANRANINAQIRTLGSSCDWSREKFTLDPCIIKTVYNTFAKLAKDRLVYRGSRIINWCPKHQTSFSDLEIKNKETVDNLYFLKYGPFVIATARPETKFGDKYVVVHPRDKRYANFSHCEKIKIEWINGPIEATIIKDESIDMEFGTGAMTITPWHDNADFLIAEKHGLEKEQIIDWQGKLLKIAGEFAGLHINKARAIIIQKMEQKGLVDHIDKNYKHIVRTCYKCDVILEPQIKEQWFVKMQPLAQKAIEKITTHEIRFIPQQYKKIVLHWLNNITDWNISRQIVWGIPIPAKICVNCNKGFVDIDNIIDKCEKCGNEVRPDTDTFDTWFSSGQWPFASLGYPDSSDYSDFYPTDVLETAGEIIFFWVARMIMLGLYTTKQIPFTHVYLHGLVLDAHGKKMSKSKGNVINPIEITNKFGTDALRMSLIVGNTPGTSLALSENQIKGYKHFANKIWNVARFVLENTNSLTNNLNCVEKPTLTEHDIEIIENLEKLVTEITLDLEQYKFYLAAEKIYHYFWHTFADVIIEQSKDKLRHNSKETNQESVKYMLREVLATSLKLLHPFMPFITEEIWQYMHENNNKDYQKLLMIEKWPSLIKK